MIKIIGEIGVNHNGKLSKAKSLAYDIKSAGCDYVKTQLWNSERVYKGDDIAKMKLLELSRADIENLNSYCQMIGIPLIVTPDEIDDAKFLRDLGMPIIKTSSQDVTNIPFLEQIGKLNMQVIYSTGACDYDEMARGYNAIGRNDTISLHCVSAYPAPLDQMNLRSLCRLEWLAQKYGTSRAYGLSDHTKCTEAAIMALALGATWFEKHVTFSRSASGPDHKASMTPEDLRKYVDTLRRCEPALGDGIKRVMPCEEENRKRYEAFRDHRQSLAC